MALNTSGVVVIIMSCGGYDTCMSISSASWGR